MNLNALERLARRALARQGRPALISAGDMQYSLTGPEYSALHSSRWQTTARVAREDEGEPPVVVAPDTEIGGWF